jgi:hypothetical protein
VSAVDPLGPVPHKLACCIRMLLSANDYERAAGILGVERILQTVSTDGGVDIHALANRIEKSNGSLTDADKQKIRSEIENARAKGYAEGVRAAEARFRPDGKLEFSEVALFVERQINRLPPDKHEFIHKMAFYARQELEPSSKQGKFLFDLFVQYLGGRIT